MGVLGVWVYLWMCDLKKGLNANKIKGTLKIVRWTETLGSKYRPCFFVLNQ